ncbi:unnamed protein product [Adineta steineri]|uniref:Uncharacterized protein n=1 Tax=Adineta steineri TaxID=433720 RepID=A0A813ZDU5_9BILA|nr:unnamed protein product [Adineta steineri]
MDIYGFWLAMIITQTIICVTLYIFTWWFDFDALSKTALDHISLDTIIISSENYSTFNTVSTDQLLPLEHQTKQNLTTTAENDQDKMLFKLLWKKAIYRNFAINHCGFSTTMDIGYGNCTPYCYQNATSIQLCMCSTDFCSDTYSSCQASVNQARSSPPPSMPVLQPTLSNIITCQDAYVNLSAALNIIPPMYMGCNWFMNFGDADFYKCSSCSPNYTLICGVWYDPIQGSFQQMGMIEGAYKFLMEAMIENAALSDNSSSDVYLYQTSTSIATFWYVSSE